MYIEYDFDEDFFDLEWFCFDSECYAFISERLYADLEHSDYIVYKLYFIVYNIYYDFDYSDLFVE